MANLNGKIFKINLDRQKAALFLKDGIVGVIPTDTIYGICGSAFNKKTVEKIYKLRKRNPKKPVIVLIADFDDLKKFGVKISGFQKKILNRLWPGKASVILKCSFKKFFYLHRGTKTIAFRMPKNKKLIEILKISGPLVAPSANWEGYPPAKNIKEAKKYFGNKVFYLDRGNLISKPSKLIDLTGKIPKVLR
ncbi:threonylcarbamoyl-AMP synthase [Candidatus Wolfebacteria bacterium]|nr:threonylcarbamoyl-AMP synthase [Candidatus Wolfebacteria bacterium]